MTGFENIPLSYIEREKRVFLRIAQSNSRAVIPGSDDYIDGLRPGNFFTSTGVVLGDVIDVIMLKFYATVQVRESTTIMARNIATLSLDDFQRIVPTLTKTDGGYFVDKAGHKYEEQANFVVLSVQYPELGAMILSLRSSELPKARVWLQQAMKIQALDEDGKGEHIAPMWSSIWTIKSGLEQKTDKKTNGKFMYYGIESITRKGWTPKNISLEVQEIFAEVQNTPVLYTPLTGAVGAPQIKQIHSAQHDQPRLDQLPNTTIGNAVASLAQSLQTPSDTITGKQEFLDDIPF